jgi:hypothetical protein
MQNTAGVSGNCGYNGYGGYTVTKFMKKVIAFSSWYRAQKAT